jgi:hypothetical protein
MLAVVYWPSETPLRHPLIVWVPFPLRRYVIAICRVVPAPAALSCAPGTKSWLRLKKSLPAIQREA